MNDAKLPMWFRDLGKNANKYFSANFSGKKWSRLNLDLVIFAPNISSLNISIE